MIDKDNAIGLDYKSDGLYVDSNGYQPPLHKYYRESQEKLAKLQRKLSRKVGSKKGETKSSNYLKQQMKVNKLHNHISNQRKDHLHKKSTEIANQYDIVCVEDLNMRAMSNKGFGNGKATMDNGYGMFLNMLEFDTPTTKVVGFLLQRVPRHLIRLYQKAIDFSLTHSPQA